MTTRERLIAEVSTYLGEQFSAATIGTATDGLTANEVLTVTEGGAVRHVEVTKRWLEGDDAGVPLGYAIREWDLAAAVRRLEPNATLRVGTTGFERVA
jgi:hypothetical protein